MPRSSRLLTALDRYKGKDYKLEKQKKLQKQAEKRKRAKASTHNDESEEDEADKGGVILNDEEKEGSEVLGVNGLNEGQSEEEHEEDEGDEEDDEKVGQYNIDAIDDSLSSSGDEEDEDDEDDGKGDDLPEEDIEEEDDIPLSDLDSVASDDKGDIIPHQRLTINNTTALLSALSRISIPRSALPFSAHMSLTTDIPVNIPDTNDDLNRELAFYKQALSAVTEARQLLRKEGTPFTRPADYFAEMVKSDEHMGKVKKKLVDEAAGKKAAAEARRQRDLKKFGKAVQVARLQERDKAKRETLDKISALKRKRKGAEVTSTNESEELFDIALDDSAEMPHRQRDRRTSGSRGQPNAKRQKKNEKYGFGGKKRFTKSTDAASSADMRGFSVRRMKGKAGAGGGNKRPGKSKRVKRI